MKERTLIQEKDIMTYTLGPLIQKKDIVTYERAVYKIEDSQENMENSKHLRNMDMDITTLQSNLNICKENNRAKLIIHIIM